MQRFSIEVSERKVKAGREAKRPPAASPCDSIDSPPQEPYASPCKRHEPQVERSPELSPLSNG